MEQDINIKQTVSRLKSYVLFIWKKKIWIIGISVSIALCIALWAFTQPVSYKAQLSFMINDEGQSGSSMAAILGNFGFGGGATTYNYDKLLSIAKTNKIMYALLYEEVDIDGKKDLMANHIIRVYDLHRKWEEDEDTLMQGYVFSDETRYNEKQRHNVARQRISAMIRGNPDNPGDKLLEFSFDKTTTILDASAETLNEQLSIALVEKHYSLLSNFYVQKAVERQKKSYDLLAAKSDSVFALLRSAEQQLALATDRSLGLYLQQDKLPQIRLNRDIMMYSTMYAEILKNKETAEFVLNNQTPFFQLLDQPVFPLFPQQKGFVKFFIMGLFFSGFFLVLFFGFYAMIRENYGQQIREGIFENIE